MKEEGQQKGSAIIMALFMFMIISLIGAALLSVAAVEKKVVISQNRVEMLNQAADSGVQMARKVIMNYLAAGQDIPAFNDFYLENGLRVEMSCDLSGLEKNGVIKITSRAYMQDLDGKVMASKGVRADLWVDCLPDQVVKARTLKVAGRYYSVLSQQAIDDLGNQDWDVNHIESSLAGDPVHPSSYPLEGPSYDSLAEECQISHPNFHPVQQQWPGIQVPDHSWWVDYQYDNLDGEGFHDVENSHIYMAPYYNPLGYLEVVNKEGGPEKIGIEQGWNNSLTVDEQNQLFIDNLTNPIWGQPMSEQYYQSQVISILKSSGGTVIYPDRELNSQDFIKTAQVIENIPAPTMPGGLLDNYRQLARLGGEWDYIAQGSDKLSFYSGKYQIDINSLDKTYIYIDCAAGDTVVLDFNSVLAPSGYCLTEWLDSNQGMFFNRIRNQQQSVIIVSTADLEVIMDNIMFEHLSSGTSFYIISPGNINLSLIPVIGESSDCPRNIQAFLWAGKNIHIYSGVTGCNYTGLINAGNNLYIELGNTVGMPEDEPYFRVEKNEVIIQQFPQAWAYLGMAPVITYTHID